MATRKLKDFFNADLVRDIAAELSRADPKFDAAGFAERGLRGLEQQELTARAWHLADAMRLFLPQPFPRAADIIVASLGPEIPPTGENGLSPLRYMPHVFFVQKYGLDHFEASMQAQYELTKRFSTESSIRAFLMKYPKETYARLAEWARDDNAHVRRLVSEGTRPRLPWAPRLRAFQDDPNPVIALLEILKDDPVRYVQRSVANNLNDISKDHPALAIEVCRRWGDSGSEGRQWIIRHALRSLVKRANPGALKIFGVAAKPKVCISRVRLVPRTVKLGGTLQFSFEIANIGKQTQELLIDYAVHFVKASGTTRPKVFKLRKICLSPAARKELGSTVSFENMTTRRHYPGRHRIDLLINGVSHPLTEFDVKPD